MRDGRRQHALPADPSPRTERRHRIDEIGDGLGLRQVQPPAQVRAA
jgi:hypothetical protein